MNWYLAKLMFQDKGSGEVRSQRQDEHWRLIQADELAWAIEKATVLGWLQQQGTDLDTTHRNQEFLGVAEIVEMPVLEDGAQLPHSIQTC
jgi:hypothetical protein